MVYRANSVVDMIPNRHRQEIHMTRKNRFLLFFVSITDAIIIICSQNEPG